MGQIREADIKKLWGLAAGRCAYPGCNIALIHFAPDEDAVVIGEMAHVIARRPTGPRGRDGSRDDTYENLILLCPTHHALVDKTAEGTFTPELLLDWKKQHESRMAQAAADRAAKLSPDTSGIKVTASSREYVSVHVVVTRTGQRYGMELPLDILVGHAIPELVRLLELPEHFANAWPVHYHLYSKTHGRVFNEALTLRQNAVADGETLSLHVHMEAG